MSALAPTLQAFFTDRLIRQRHASPHTIAAYRDTLRLLLALRRQATRQQPCQLDIGDLDAPMIAAFLDHLEHERGNSVRTRNARLAAIHSLFRYAALQHPEHAEDISACSRSHPSDHDRGLVTFLNEHEIDALLAAPDRSTWTGRRDHAMLLLAIQTGLRASELTGSTAATCTSAPARTSAATARAAKQRITPLTQVTVAVLRVWLAERAGEPDEPLFPTIRGERLSRDALERRLAKHASTAAHRCPSLQEKKITCTRSDTPPRCDCCTPASTPPSSPSGSDTSASTPRRSTSTPTSPSRNEHSPEPSHPSAKPGRYQPPDKLLAFLEAL